MNMNGGDCSLCGAKKVNKATCPFNHNAKRPNSEKHSDKKKQNTKKQVKTTKKVVKTKTIKRKQIKSKSRPEKSHNIAIELNVITRNGEKIVKSKKESILKNEPKKNIELFIKNFFFGIPLNHIMVEKNHQNIKLFIDLEDANRVGLEYDYISREHSSIRNAMDEIVENIQEVGNGTTMELTYDEYGKPSSKYFMEVIGHRIL
jgi:hypothetical protein